MGKERSSKDRELFDDFVRFNSKKMEGVGIGRYITWIRYIYYNYGQFSFGIYPSIREMRKAKPLDEFLEWI